ncbi:3-dehydroquinate synthase [Methylocapsa sp. S129]|uniref:3-dehydroquinate synthase n=1 Tax=Methylocapsa sp. S129 TaxID=1641869 RepID=UPI00131CC25F|nr:3-dehydroquinate synthase [Methylocapsa sp. S129]
MTELAPPDREALVAALGGRSIVLVGMMGAGKTSVGRRLAAHLNLPFVDADGEIEAGAQMTVPEIFERFGESYFRDGERKVVARLLTEGQKVLATGGGAFMNEATRARIAQSGVSIWLKPDFDVLMRRVRKRSNRPLLQTDNPEETLRRLLQERGPIYGLADLTIEPRDGPHDAVVEAIMSALGAHLASPRAAALNGAAPAAAIHEVEVALGVRAYKILIGDGLIAGAGEHIARLAPGAHCAVVTDSNVAALHLDALNASLAAAGLRSSTIVVPPGESSKSYARFAEVCDGLLAAHIERRDLVIAFGGGVIGDLTGFAAASVRRGLRLVQIPTTLLAQVDSSVGGKTAINSPHGKNLVGAFHQPSLVLADIGALDTLSQREFRAGYAETVKYGLIGDLPFFEWLEAHWRDVYAGGPARLRAVATSCAAKAAVVAADETEQGERALLNLGHTFAHAFERMTNYDGALLVHGEAVAIGMACAFRFSRALGFCNGQDAVRVENHLRAVGLPTHMHEIAGLDAEPEAILAAMRQDKKVERGRLTFILAKGIGESFIAKDVDEARVRDFLRDELARNG